MLNVIMQTEYLLIDCTMITLVSFYVVYFLAVQNKVENRVRDVLCPTRGGNFHKTFFTLIVNTLTEYNRVADISVELQWLEQAGSMMDE